MRIFSLTTNKYFNQISYCLILSPPTSRKCLTQTLVHVSPGNSGGSGYSTMYSFSSDDGFQPRKVANRPGYVYTCEPDLDKQCLLGMNRQPHTLGTQRRPQGGEGTEGGGGEWGRVCSERSIWGNKGGLMAEWKTSIHPRKIHLVVPSNLGQVWYE